MDTWGNGKGTSIVSVDHLDRNPLKVDPNTIRDIDVVETVKSGKSVYRAPKG
jgi:hypothetical protein